MNAMSTVTVEPEQAAETIEITPEVRVVVVDDHEIVRRGIRCTLESAADITVVGEAGSGRAARRLLSSCAADLVLMDVRLGDCNGITLLRELRGADPALRSLLVTAASDDAARLSAMVGGADGYLCKQVVGFDLVGSVRTVGRERDPLGASRPVAVVERLHDVIAGLAEPQDRAALHLIADQLATGRSDAEIADELALSVQVVGSQVSEVLRMIELAELLGVEQA